MVTVEALKLLYKKLGGTANVDNITAISDMVDLIEDVAGGGGGGASGLVVTVTADWENHTYTLDKNYTEITSVVNNGITPVFLILLDGVNQYYLFGGNAEIEYEGQTMYIVLLYDPHRSGDDGLLLIQFVSDSATGTLVGGEDS